MAGQTMCGLQLQLLRYELGFSDSRPRFVRHYSLETDYSLTPDIIRNLEEGRTAFREDHLWLLVESGVIEKDDRWHHRLAEAITLDVLLDSALTDSGTDAEQETEQPVTLRYLAEQTEAASSRAQNATLVAQRSLQGGLNYVREWAQVAGIVSMVNTGLLIIGLFMLAVVIHTLTSG